MAGELIELDLSEASRASFMSRVDKSGELRVKDLGRCWKWVGKTVTKKGYGRLWLDGRAVLAHRVAFYLHNNRWPSDLCCHHCDNPICVNPAHLYDGTAKDNALDMVKRGRIRRTVGEAHAQTKFSDSEALEILAAHEARFLQKDIAKAYDVDQTTVSLICIGKHWRHVSLANLDDAGKSRVLERAQEKLRSVGAKPRSPASKYRGVGKLGSGWRVSCRNKYVGYFDCETDAARAYDMAAVRELGERAVVNFEVPGAAVRRVLFGKVEQHLRREWLL